jgi:hypothetical protein
MTYERLNTYGSIPDAIESPLEALYNTDDFK